jgi:hypothetical protein
MFDKLINKIFGTNDNQIDSRGLPVVTSNPPVPKVKKPKAKTKPKAKPKTEKPQLSEKEKATLKKEPWVDVIGFRVNPDNVRNGFFEIDWNDHWIEKLKQEGYGFDGDPEDEIIGRWYRDICYNAAAAEGIDISDQDFGILRVNK